MRKLRLYILLFGLLVVLGLRAQDSDAQLSIDNAVDTIGAIETMDDLDTLRAIGAMETMEELKTIGTLNALEVTDMLETTNNLNSQLSTDSIKLARELKREQRALARANFKPDPNKSLWLALTFPGAGQIYNRKYWKLPIIYGGAVGVSYAISFYGGRYNDYMKGYRDYLDTDPKTNYHLELLPQGYPESSAGTYVKNAVNSYRRYRDIFIVVGVAVYALSVIDAYVDAQLADFDISTDLSMKVRPKLDVELHTGKPAAGCQMQIYF